MHSIGQVCRVRSVCSARSCWHASIGARTRRSREEETFFPGIAGFHASLSRWTVSEGLRKRIRRWSVTEESTTQSDLLLQRRGNVSCSGLNKERSRGVLDDRRCARFSAKAESEEETSRYASWMLSVLRSMLARRDSRKLFRGSASTGDKYILTPNSFTPR